MLISSELWTNIWVIIVINISFCMGSGINIVRIRFARCLTILNKYVLALELPGELI